MRCAACSSRSDCSGRRRSSSSITPSPSFALEAFSDPDADVAQSIARIKADPFIPRTETVRGFVYEVETGKLREVS